MSIAEELEKLNELHRSGALNDSEFESAKAHALGASSAPSVVVAPPVVSRSVTDTKGPGWRTWVVVFAITLAGAWLFLRQTVGERAVAQITAAVIHAPINLRDEVQSLPASSWKALGLTLPYTGNLSVTVAVTKGNAVDVFVVDEANLQRLKDKIQVKQFTDFEAMGSRTYQRSARLKQGTYYLVLRDRTLGILSASNSDVKVVARLEP